MTPPIRQFYNNQNIFLTGGTGFMGIITVEKLLRSFPDIGNIYMLVRPKKGITVEERKKTYFDNPVFDRLKSEQNMKTFSQKLHWIEGDITEEHLGLSETIIRKLQNEINLVIHGAAELRIQIPLKCYVESNIRATYDLLKIAEGCTQLCGFVYIGTAYCQLRHGFTFTPETILKANISPRKLIKMTENMTTEEMQTHVKEIVNNRENAYSYSKSCAESLCAEFEDLFPIAIFRPASVGHTYAEPKPHYIGNNLGVPRILFEANRGFVMFCDPKTNANLVPVDLTINALLAVTREISQRQFRKVKVYNYSTTNHPCTVSDAYRYYSRNIPAYETVLVPHRYRLMAMHDATPGSIEDKMRQKIKRFYDFYKEINTMFTFTNYTFANDNIDALWRQMGAEDKALLPFDVRSCDWEKYFSEMVANQYGFQVPKFDDLVADPRKRIDAEETFIRSLKSKY